MWRYIEKIARRLLLGPSSFEHLKEIYRSSQDTVMKTQNYNARLFRNFTEQTKISQIQHECVEMWHSRGQSTSKLCMINDQLINPAKHF